jgi:hypothetical protein
VPRKRQEFAGFQFGPEFGERLNKADLAEGFRTTERTIDRMRADGRLPEPDPGPEGVCWWGRERLNRCLRDKYG